MRLAPFAWACWRGLPLARHRPCGLVRQQQHWRTAPAQHFPKAAAAFSDNGSSLEQPPQPLVPSSRLEQRQQQWQARLLEVVAFHRQHGWVPRQRPGPGRPLVEGEAELGRWCAQQRRRRDGSWGEPLRAEETAALRAIPGWCWGKEKKARRPYVRLPWEEWLKQVAAFIVQHGRLPRQTAGKAEPFLHREEQLGTWCFRQRQHYKGQGTGAPLTAGQVTALEALPGWFWEQKQVQPWEDRLQQVADFVVQHGRLPRMKAGRAQPFLEGEQQLGEWCNNQRQRHKGQGTGGPLTVEQMAALDGIPGWRWDLSALWQLRLEEVAAFVAQHGRLPRQSAGKAQAFLEGEQRLGEWCKWQRQRYKGLSTRGPLTLEQVAALEALPGWFWGQVQVQPWEQRLQQVAAFVEQHGRLPRLAGSKSDPQAEGEVRLGRWVQKQRQRKKGQGSGGPLTAEQVAKLEAFLWWRW